MQIERDRLEAATRHLHEAEERFSSVERQYQDEYDLLEAEACSLREDAKEAQAKYEGEKKHSEELIACIERMKEEKKRASSQPPRFSEFRERERNEPKDELKSPTSGKSNDRRSRSVGRDSESEASDSGISTRSRSLSQRRAETTDTSKILRIFFAKFCKF